MHLKDKDCDIKDKVEKGLILKSRYESYERIISEVK
jgi:putative ribosome biogenesis GTPase RsgA